jgi:peptide deformylase
MSFKFDPKRINRPLNTKVENVLKKADKKGCLRITQVGEKVLRQNCPEFKGDIKEENLRKLIAAMKVTMHEAPGVGLAAPQIDLNLNLAVIEDLSNTEGSEDDPDDIRETSHVPFYVVINPSYEALEDDGSVDPDSKGMIVEPLFYEGCLSFANHYAARYRFHRILAKWTDEKGRDHEEIMTGWPARIFQHETDHLSGEVYIDKAIIRSLSTSDNLSEYELDEDIELTAKNFGFEI